LLRPVVEGLVWLVGKIGWRNRAADPALEGMVEASYGFIDPWDEGKERCPSLYLECLAVEPEFQGKGVGRMLVQHGLGLAEEAGISASVISADGKEEFYRKCGYDVGPVGRSGEGEGNPLWAVPGGMVFFREAPSKQSSEKERSAEVEEALRWLKKDNETGWPSVWLDAKAAV
jgi:GNAT superfamily N-acetyltransferase